MPSTDPLDPQLFRVRLDELAGGQIWLELERLDVEVLRNRLDLLLKIADEGEEAI